MGDQIDMFTSRPKSLGLKARHNDPETARTEMNRKDKTSGRIAQAILAVLLQHPKGLTEGELAKILVSQGVVPDRTSVTPCVAPMVRAGKIIRPGEKRGRGMVLYAG